MATAAEFRAELAREFDLYHSGEVETATTATITDTKGLARFVNPDQLIGGTVSTMEDKGTSFTDVQWRHITGYNGAGVITVEYPILAPAAGDPYEVFMALTPDQWDQAINDAIRAAWPSVFEVRHVNPSTRGGSENVPAFQFAETFDSVLALTIEDPVNFPGYGAVPIPRGVWVYGSPMSTNGKGTLTVSKPIRSSIELANIHAYVSGRYPTYDSSESFLEGTYPTMDQEYIRAQARANIYNVLADATHVQSHVSNHQTMAQYWQGEATRRKAELASALAGADYAAIAPK